MSEVGVVASGGARGDDEGSALDIARREVSLQDYVWQQFAQVVREPKLRLAGKFLIDALDENGYLRVDVAAAAASLRVSEEVVDDARAIIQTLDPVGIGARDLAECLRLQLHARGQLEAVTEACLAHLDWVAVRDWGKLAIAASAAQGYPVDEEEVKLAVQELQACDPKPALKLAAAGRVDARVASVVPDVLIEKVESGAGDEVALPEGWRVVLNGAAFPRLLANPLGSFGGQGKAAQAAKQYANERYGRAKWLLNALEQRAKTTLAIAKEMVRRQRQFLDAGPEFLVPLTLREVAEVVGVHESTVSRVVSGKYILTPHGVLGFKAFFGSGVASSGGQVAVAASSVQALIAKLVKAENPTKPLSDEVLVAKLKEEGVEVARRTVAKYRGVLGIPGTSERRVRPDGRMTG
ncbi:MAG: RNA polymerase sigma-54 factor [Proteobacteria bacterium]|nr:RNA polymerase sigma-54 factor [Pseudomonadota bacterium]